MPPGPSDPANMPIRRKIRSAGTPSLPEALLAMTLRKRRIDAPRRMYSIEVIIQTRSQAKYFNSDGQAMQREYRRCLTDRDGLAGLS
jgi:hypothetical protein